MDGTADPILLRSHSRFFEDFHLGERFMLPARTMSHEVFEAFRLVSGDTHRLHHDPDYCRALGLPGARAHEFQVLLVTAAGASVFQEMVEGSLVGLIDQSSRFVRPVHEGDTLQPVLQVIELEPNTSTGIVTLRSTIHNQRRELVLEGTQRYLLRQRAD